jgi:hypothetical protein
MSIFPCSVCGQKPVGKIATVYSAWFQADGGRVAWKQRLCASCVSSTLRDLLRSASDSSQDVAACPACGTDASSDLDPIYLTLYLPKQDPREYALTTCGVCAAQLRLTLIDGAARLPDRVGGQNGGSSQADDWAGVL